ncbi:IPT/TIG domain-containing protein, partial [bacterium]|nr:IPT/TIG domain-containing protein [bacterium]
NGTGAGSFTVDSDSQLRAVVPPAATTGKIKVTTLEGTAESEDDFIVIQAPSVTDFTPKKGPVGTEVNLIGNGFSSVTEVSFGGTVADVFTVDSDSQLRAEVPSAASSGPIRVVNVAGSDTTPDFSVTHPPVILSLSPSSAVVGTEVRIVGIHFSGTSDVTFNGIATTFVVDTDTELRAVVPSGATRGKIRVSNADGTGEGAVDFIPILPPTLASFDPISGLVGTEVTIVGSNFTPDSEVLFNGLPVIDLAIDSDQRIRAKVPQGATDGKITIHNIAGSVTSDQDFDVTPAPTSLTFKVTDDTYVRADRAKNNYGDAGSIHVKQSATSKRHGYIKFSVTGLTGPVQSAKVRALVVNDSPSAGSIYLVSNNYEGTDTPWNENGLNWNNAPAITGESLSSLGAAAIGDTVEFDVTAAIAGDGIYSFGFMNGSSNRLKLDTKEDGGTPIELIVDMLSSPVPIIVSVNPNSGIVGSEVTLQGFNLSSTSAVSFNGTGAGSFTVDSDSQLRAVVPPAATTGKIKVTTLEGTAESEDDFIV